MARGLTVDFLVGTELALIVVIVEVLVLGFGFAFALLFELVAGRVLATAFLMLGLSAFDAGLRIFFLLLRCDVEDSSRTFSRFRFLPTAEIFLGS